MSRAVANPAKFQFSSLWWVHGDKTDICQYEMSPDLKTKNDMCRLFGTQLIKILYHPNMLTGAALVWGRQKKTYMRQTVKKKRHAIT